MRVNLREIPHLGIVGLAIGATVSRWIEYRLLSNALAWRVGRTKLAGRWLAPIAVGCAVAAAVAFFAQMAFAPLPAIIEVVLVLGPAGLAYLGVTRRLGVPESLATAARLATLARRVAAVGAARGPNAVRSCREGSKVQAMFKVFKRWWAYITAKLGSSLEERADPKIQLEQAIAEAQDQQRRLKEQAANVIAHQKQTELRLNRAMVDLEKVNGNARQALLMADEASKTGDQAKTTQYTATAESFANRLIALEREVEDLKALHLQSTEAANQAKAAVQQNSSALQQKLAERQKLLSQLDQAKMQEQMNAAMSSLSEAVGQDVPTLNEVRDKIEARYAKAKGMAELTESTVESRMLEVEQASLNSEAQARLDQIRSQLGLTSGNAAAGELPEMPTPADAPVEGTPGTAGGGAGSGAG